MMAEEEVMKKYTSSITQYEGTKRLIKSPTYAGQKHVMAKGLEFLECQIGLLEDILQIEKGNRYEFE